MDSTASSLSGSIQINYFVAQLNFIISAVELGLFTLSLGLFIYKVKLIKDLDASMKVFLVAILICQGFKFASWLLLYINAEDLIQSRNVEPSQALINEVTSLHVGEHLVSYIMMIIQFFFILQMGTVYDTLHSLTPKELQRKLRFKRTLFAVAIVLHCFTLFTLVLEDIDVAAKDDLLSAKTVMDIKIAGVACGFVVNAYMLTQLTYYMY